MAKRSGKRTRGEGTIEDERSLPGQGGDRQAGKKDDTRTVLVLRYPGSRRDGEDEDPKG